MVVRVHLVSNKSGFAKREDIKIEVHELRCCQSNSLKFNHRCKQTARTNYTRPLKLPTDPKMAVINIENPTACIFMTFIFTYIESSPLGTTIWSLTDKTNFSAWLSIELLTVWQWSSKHWCNSAKDLHKFEVAIAMAAEAKKNQMLKERAIEIEFKISRLGLCPALLRRNLNKVWH